MFKLSGKHKRRSTPASMYDCLDQCAAEWSLTGNPHHRRSANYSDGFWKVFMLDGRSKHCCVDDGKSWKRNSVYRETVLSQACQCMTHTKTARRRRFRSQSGYYLAILPNGQIMGVKDTTSPYIDIDIIPVGADLVKIWGVESELFIMIDDAGHMRGTDVDSAECIFEETLTENFFNVYYSAMYYHKRWCVGLKNKQQTRSFYRKPKPATDTSFMIEVVRRRSSTSSACSSSDVSGGSSS